MAIIICAFWLRKFLTGIFAYATLNAMRDLPIVNKNIRYLLWKAKPRPESWGTVLAEWIGISESRAGQLLNAAQPTMKELSELAEVTHQEAESILYGELFADEEILRNNLSRLIEGLGHGGQRELAARVNVDQSTISRWKAGKQQLHKKHLDELRRFFQLPESVDLTRDPIFLSLDPLGVGALRKWALEKLEAMPGEELVQLYPAMKKLLG